MGISSKDFSEFRTLPELETVPEGVEIGAKALFPIHTPTGIGIITGWPLRFRSADYVSFNISRRENREGRMAWIISDTFQGRYFTEGQTPERAISAAKKHLKRWGRCNYLNSVISNRAMFSGRDQIQITVAEDVPADSFRLSDERGNTDLVTVDWSQISNVPAMTSISGAWVITKKEEDKTESIPEHICYPSPYNWFVCEKCGKVLFSDDPDDFTQWVKTTPAHHAWKGWEEDSAQIVVEAICDMGLSEHEAMEFITHIYGMVRRYRKHPDRNRSFTAYMTAIGKLPVPTWQIMTVKQFMDSIPAEHLTGLKPLLQKIFEYYREKAEEETPA